jgi:hypothetical protein
MLPYLHNFTSVAKLKMLNRGVAFKGGGVKAQAPADKVASAHISAEAVVALEDIALGKFYKPVRGHPAPVPRGPVAIKAARSSQT